MNKMKMEKEASKWVEKGIITEEQLGEIVAQYKKTDGSYLLIIFALLLTSIGVLLFAFSEWTGLPEVVRVVMMLVFMSALYLFGDYLYKKRSPLFGISLIILGYIFFGATLFLTLIIYNVEIVSAWPVLIWSVVGLIIYAIYKHPYLFFVALIITLIGQLVGYFTFNTINYILFGVFVFGYFHFVFHHQKVLFNYLFSIGLALQLAFLTFSLGQSYYWLLFYFLLMYVVSEIMNKVSLKQALLSISLLSVFIVRIIETFLLQDDYFMKEISVQPLYLILLTIVLLGLLAVKGLHGKRLEIVDLVVFLPYFLLPMGYIYVIVSMFIFAIYWLVFSLRHQSLERFIFGIVAFFISTFTAYIQFAWETMNKSLFFIIGGLLLFGIGFLFQKQKRTFDELAGGDE